MSPQTAVENLVCVVNKHGTFNPMHLHVFMHKAGLDAYAYGSLENRLLSMLVEAGNMRIAHKVFDSLYERTSVSWDYMINGYLKCGEPRCAFAMYEKMQALSLFPSEHICVALLKACSELKDTARGCGLHDQLDNQGLLRKNVFVGNALVGMYAKWGYLTKAQEVFDMLPVRDVVTWTSLIAGYVEHGYHKGALNCYENMCWSGVSPNEFTFSCILKACGSTRSTDKGMETHADMEIRGWMRASKHVCNALVNMYVKCGMIEEARQVFDNITEREVISWTVLIAGYIDQELAEEALSCYKQMQQEDVSPNPMTLVCSLNACGCIQAIEEGKGIHDYIVRNTLLESNLILGTALVDMYAKCGLLEEAQDMFTELPMRDVIMWTALIGGYVQYKHCEKALTCFKQMRAEGLCPDPVTIALILKACGSVGSAEKGREIHAEVVPEGLLVIESALGKALVDMYACCGLLSQAQEVFENIPSPDLVSWTVLITGYAQIGDINNVIRMFDRMREDGHMPDFVTFVTVLKACSHAGMVDKGQEYFAAMRESYGLSPALKHYSCIVDLLGRAGQLDVAAELAKGAPLHPSSTMWHTVLGACQKWSNPELGREAFEESVQMDDEEAASYVCMGNLYAHVNVPEK